MRGDHPPPRPPHHSAAGEPCLLPLRMSSSPSSDKSLLADARKGDLSAMRKKMRNSIFRRPEDVNQRDERHCTPMHYAAKNGHIDMIKSVIIIS